ncbi:hypothetical protein [Hyphomonas sp.]|uniref:hypothetical protein n=1 Tax=Hyphomonas sp. TaxID=87 RepID=UPI003F6E901F
MKGPNKGQLYARPPIVETELDAALLLSNDEVFARLPIGDPKASGYLRSECLVHLMRAALAQDKDTHFNRILPVLLKRCERILRSKISERIVSDAEGLREVILQDLCQLFIEDWRDPKHNKLDIFECRFNMAFRSLRLDKLEKVQNHNDNFQDLPRAGSGDDDRSDDDVLAQISDASWTLPLQDSAVMARELYDAIEGLPPDIRKALILCKFYQLKEESSDPSETTAAQLCKCSGRTIRSRLTKAKELLAPFKEYL